MTWQERIARMLPGMQAQAVAGREQAAIFAEGAEEHGIKELLCSAEDFVRGDGGVFGTQTDEDFLPEIGVERVELIGEFSPDGFGIAEQGVEVAIAVIRDDASRAEQEDETPQQRGLAGESRGFKTLIGLLIRALVIEPRFPHGGDDDPVAREIDGVAIGLIDGGHASPGEGAVERIPRGEGVGPCICAKGQLAVRRESDEH